MVGNLSDPRPGREAGTAGMQSAPVAVAAVAKPAPEAAGVEQR